MKVFLSPLAELKLELLIIYLEEVWGETSKKTFLNKLKELIKVISDYPKSYPRSPKFGTIYKAVITKQTSIFYRIHQNEIEIITISDNRQDPETVEKEIKKHFKE